MKLQTREMKYASPWFITLAALIFGALLIAIDPFDVRGDARNGKTGAAIPATWPCPLPTAEGERAVVVVEKHGARYDITCRDLQLPNKPIPSRGVQ